ncbi:MAG: hypothetical protein KKF54_06780 [Candidatus Omnitrophica bacterium]|nr:hypothetical protein [Candidatus Omnitrophota bacterium]
MKEYPKTIRNEETGRIYCSNCGFNGFKKTSGQSNKITITVKEVPYWSDKEQLINYVSFDYTVYLTCAVCGQRHKEYTQHYGNEVKAATV